MPENNPKKIIIKRGHGGGHGAAHGGAWKVAYADFVTAMMAFFLLMWLLNSTTKEQKEELAGYFKEFSLFDKGGEKPLFTPSHGKPIAMQPQPVVVQVVPSGADMAKEKLRSEVAEELEKKLADMKDQILIDTFEDGVRVQVVHKDGNPIFDVGGTSLSRAGLEALKGIAESLKDNDNKIAIEGHTDARVYKDSKYTNWELSTARASTARIILEQNGIPQSRLMRVAGYADSQPLVKGNPEDPRNRRISVLIYNKQEKKAPEAPKVIETPIDLNTGQPAAPIAPTPPVVAPPAAPPGPAAAPPAPKG